MGVRDARIGFAGPSVIKNTIFSGNDQRYYDSIPPGFQSAERAAQNGLLDMIVSEQEQKTTIEQIVDFFESKQQPESKPEADTNDRAPRALEFCYRECRGPQHTLPQYYAHQAFTNVVSFASDGAISVSLARISGRRVLLINSVQNLADELCGLGTPVGYRRVAKLVGLASQFSLPVVSIVDTAGALPSPDTEDRGQAQAISLCL